jgi:phosphoglycerate dehydrogenase-like enzyme
LRQNEPVRVHISGEWNPDEIDQILRASRQPIEITYGDVQDAEVLVDGRASDEILEKMPSLRHVVVPWAGLPKKLGEVLADYPQITAHNLHHNAVSTAEMALTLMMACAKRLVECDGDLRRGHWATRMEPGGPSTHSLACKRVLIFGFGEIGLHVARVCQALQMQVVGVRREARDRDGFHVIAFGDLEDELPQTDVLVVCAPLTPETEGAIGERELGLLPENAIVVNVGRGPIIEEAALYEACRSRRLFAAGSDVWYQYPRGEEGPVMPSQFPFHELPNVVMSPHHGGMTYQTEAIRLRHLGELLSELAGGNAECNRVNVSRGY